MRLLYWLAMLALAAVPLLWGHDAVQFIFCGMLAVIGTVMLLRTPRGSRR
jgi:hypothetical protein